jgi:hypothetical protein
MVVAYASDAPFVLSILRIVCMMLGNLQNMYHEIIKK